jgi:hypothetical protein
MAEVPTEPRFPKPKVLLIDLPDAVEQAALGAGFNAHSGTFGRPFRVEPSDRFGPVFPAFHLPNYTEQEIIVIDLTPPSPSDHATIVKPVMEDQIGWWAKCSEGVIDPRPAGMVAAQNAFNRIWENGGVFVVFAAPRIRQSLVLGSVRFGHFEPEEGIKYDNWSFLPFLSTVHLAIDFDPGSESTVSRSLHVIESFLRRNQASLTFDCAFRPMYPLTWESADPKFVPLMVNKHDAIIAGVIAARKLKKGRVYILPQVKDKAAAVLQLLQSVLPELSPHLFPFTEGGKWVQQEQYEHPGVLVKQAQQAAIRARAAEEIAELDQQIAAERAALGYLHGLLTHTGDELVADVKTALAAIEFRNVVDVDQKMRQAGDTAPRREDLQAHDRSPVLIVDVKGIVDLPEDDEALQAQKHASIRVQEWKQLDVQGLAIINHQRHVPPLERDNQMPFRQEILEAAKLPPLGLMTTWDLFRLLRSFIRNNWRPEDVQPVFYRQGRIDPVPEHYEFLGTVAKVFKTSFGVVVLKELRQGDRIAIETPVEFVEQTVESLVVDETPVEVAKAEDRTGIRPIFAKGVVREKARVFCVRPTA